MNGLERLEILYHVFNQDRIEPLSSSKKMLPETGLKTKDFIAPTSFNFSRIQTFLMGRTMGSVSYLQDSCTGADRPDACRFSGCR